MHTHSRTRLRRVQPGGGGTPRTSPPGVSAAAPPALVDEAEDPVMMVAQHRVTCILGNYTHIHTNTHTYTQ